jgi:hypothetical protein
MAKPNTPSAIDRTAVGEMAAEYCNRYPTASTRMLARMLRRDQPALFANEENARGAVRYYRGEMSEADRNAMAGQPIPRFDLPTAEPPDYRVYQLPTGPKRWLVLGDVHVPYHDNAVLEAAIEFGRQRETRCTGLILLGDFLDYYKASRWEKDPRRRDIAAELDTAKQIVASIRKHLRLTHLVWKFGNHEARLDAFLRQRAPELLDVTEFDPLAWVGVDRKNDLWVPNGMPLKHRQLYMFHGNEWAGGISSPVNPARGAYLKANECCIVAHQHRSSEHTEASASGRITTCWSLGCCCDLHPEYARLNRWNHGFGVLHVRDDWRFENYRLIDGEVR